jgi:trimeric autotransporter adhesin
LVASTFVMPKSPRLRSLGFVLLALSVFSFSAFAQSYRGGVRGAVRDSGGATIPAAKVALIDAGTNVARNTVTNDSGEYVFNAVEPADYKIVVEFPGFKQLERAIRIGTQEFLTIDLLMEVGDVTESIQVTEEIPLIETSNASTGQTVDRQKLVDLPNMGRNPFMMSKISSNIVQVGNPNFNRMQDQSGSSQISIAGGPVRGNNYLVDGVPITDSINRAVIIPTIESVEEVKIQANTYDAEMGRTGGGSFNTYMKSGSNEFHGSGFGYWRRKNWAANPFFNNRAGRERPDTKWDNFGGSFGGPVWLPKVYDGRNKTFFWVGYEGYRQVSSLTNNFSVPTALERNGDFSQSVNIQGGMQTIFDPNTTVIAPNGTFTRTPFANNIIPTNRMSALGRNVASSYPDPTRAASRYAAPNFTAVASIDDTADQYTAKVDHQVTDWWRASASYLYYTSLEPGENWFGTVSSPSQWTLGRIVNATALNNLITPDPTTVISIRYGFNRFPNENGQFSSGFDLAGFGFDPSYAARVQTPVFPVVNLQQMQNLGTTSAGQTIFHSRNFLVGVSKFLGRHSVKAGFDFRRINNDGLNFGASAGNFTFDDTFTRAGTQGDNVTGSDVASMLLGFPVSGVGNQALRIEQFVDYYGGYIHDDFRLNDRVTLNFGLRFEHETGLQSPNNAVIVGFDRNAISPIEITNTAVPTTPRGALMFAGRNGYANQTGNLNPLKLSPRFGAAIKLNDKTTIRGGYGLFWAPVAYGLQGTLGWAQTTPLQGSADGGATPGSTFANPFPSGLLPPVQAANGLLSGIGQGVSFIDNNMRAPYVHQFSFDIQREIGWGVALVVGYVGSYGQNLTAGNAVNINQLEPVFYGEGPSLLSTVENPYFRSGAPGFIGQSTITRAQALRPFNQFGNLQPNINSMSRSRYDSLVIKAQKRLSQGLSFVSTYTMAQFMDNGVGAVGSSLNSIVSGFQNGYDIESEYALSGVNTPHRWSNAFTYELPFGRGRAFANSNQGT